MTAPLTEQDWLDKIIKEMLLQYTDWVNGQPVAWNVKKAEAKQAILTHEIEMLEGLLELQHQRHTKYGCISPTHIKMLIIKLKGGTHGGF